MSSRKDQLIEAIRTGAIREHAQWNVAFSEAAAARLHINASDLRQLHLLVTNGALTAGQLAEMSGLTTGGITGSIDRLARAGFVRREPDPTDRRRVWVHLIPARMRDVGGVFGPSQRAWVAMCAEYSDEELEFIMTFLTRSTALLREQTASLRRTGRSRREPRSSVIHPSSPREAVDSTDH